MKKNTFRIVLLSLFIALTLPRFALAESSPALKSISEALTDASATYNTSTVIIEYTGGSIEAMLTDDAIIFTETKENEAPFPGPLCRKETG